MDEGGAAYTWLVILLTLAVWGVCIMFLRPMIDTFIYMGLGNIGCDTGSVEVIRDTIYIWMPLTTIISLIIYAFRRSGSKVA